MLHSVFFALMFGSGRGIDPNPKLLSASDMQCIGLVVHCMSQCRMHNLNNDLPTGGPSPWSRYATPPPPPPSGPSGPT